MLFSIVAQSLQQIESASSRIVITGLLAELFREATPDESSFLAYFSLGSLYPPYHNKTFNISQKSAIKAVASFGNISHEHATAAVKQCGDVGLYVEHVARQRAGEPLLTVTEVASQLHRLLEMSGTGSQERKEAALVALLQSVTPLEAKYIVRSVVGKLRLGFSDMTLLDAYSWMISGDKTLRQPLENAYNVCADIGLVITTLKEGGIAAVAQLTITPGIPIRPAAAERLPDAQSIVDRLGTCVSQPKLDGFRLQVHVTKSGDDVSVFFFSRNLHDMSAMFPELRHCFEQLPVDSVVFEGEAIAQHPETGEFLPFQETIKRKRKHDVDDMAASVPLTLYIFDVLFLNGVSLLEESHEERRRQLAQLFINNSDERVQVIDEKIVTAANQLSFYFDEAMSHGLEGLVVKKITASYQPGKRNFNWIKLKREEDGSLHDTLDCVILGYYFGTGKRTKFGIGALLVGVYNPESDAFETIAKIGTGLTDEQWREAKAVCDGNLSSEQPHTVVCAKELYPDVWVTPTTVCMVRADNITRSPLHSAGKTESRLGYALRFPRIMGYRDDKDAQDTTTHTEVAHLYTIQDLQHKKTK